MNNLIYIDEITDSDLRRALFFYLIGFGIYLSTWVLSMGDLASGLAADPGTIGSGSTDRWVYGMLAVASFSIIVPSQLWYLKAKHTRRSNRGTGILTGVLLEAVLLAWVAAGILSFLLSTALGEGAPISIRLPILSVQFALIGAPMYYLVIVSWNAKSLVDKEGSSSRRKVASLVVGLVSAVLLFPIPYYISLVVIKALQFVSVVS